MTMSENREDNEILVRKHKNLDGAVKLGNLELVKTCIKGKSIEEIEFVLCKHNAMRYIDVEIVKWIVENYEVDRERLLYVAISAAFGGGKKPMEIVEYLLSIGETITENYFIRLLNDEHYIRDTNYDELMIMLINSGVSLTSEHIKLSDLISWGKIKVVSALIDAGVDVNKTDEGNNYQGALFVAVCNRNKAMVKKLVEAGAYIEKGLINFALKDLDIAEYLYSKGARGIHKRALNNAVYNVDYKLVKFLIGAGMTLDNETTRVFGNRLCFAGRIMDPRIIEELKKIGFTGDFVPLG